MNRFEAIMKHDLGYKMKCAYARHQQYLWETLRTTDMEIHVLGSSDAKPDWYWTCDVEAKMKMHLETIVWIRKHEHLGVFYKLFVQYIYENIMVLMGDDEFSTPYDFEETFVEWLSKKEWWPRRVPKGFRPDIHEGSLDEGENEEIKKLKLHWTQKDINEQ